MDEIIVDPGFVEVAGVEVAAAAGVQADLPAVIRKFIESPKKSRFGADVVDDEGEDAKMEGPGDQHQGIDVVFLERKSRGFAVFWLNHHLRIDDEIDFGMGIDHFLHPFFEKRIRGDVVKGGPQ